MRADHFHDPGLQRLRIPPAAARWKRSYGVPHRQGSSIAHALDASTPRRLRQDGIRRDVTANALQVCYRGPSWVSTKAGQDRFSPSWMLRILGHEQMGRRVGRRARYVCLSGVWRGRPYGPREQWAIRARSGSAAGPAASARPPTSAARRGCSWPRCRRNHECASTNPSNGGIATR